MWNKILNWLKRFWGLVLAFVALVAFLANLATVIAFAKEYFATPTPLLTPFPTATMVPTVSSTPTLGPFQFLSFPKQVRIGDDVEVILQARKDDVCTLEYYTPEETKSTAEGLGSVIANSKAQCVWRWHISGHTESGKAKLVISIQDIQETHEFEILPGE